MHLYEETPPKVDSIVDIFTQGIFYGRLRANSFGYRWKSEEILPSGENIRKNNAIATLGGSLIYKSAYYRGVSMVAGLYTTHAKGNLHKDEAYLYKSGKDVISRHELLTRGKLGITVLAQAYFAYKYKESEMKLGRQVFETFLTKSNDTKMIPNTFEGLTLRSYALPKTLIKMAYLSKQKLRDHSEFHHLFAYGDSTTSTYDNFTQNDDSAMHQGITSLSLKTKGIKDKLFIMEMRNRSIKNFELKLNYTAVPKLLSYAILQADYSLDVGDWMVIPAVRFMYQSDIGAGHIAGASIKNETSGYTHPDSLDGTMYAAKVDMIQEALKLRFAYSAIGDKADIVAPWRGFPTGGFTRAMGQHNWYANTKSYLFQVDYAFEDIADMKVISRFVVQDFDDSKAAVQADSNVFTFDLAKVFEHNLYVKTRYAHVMGKHDTIASNGFKKLDSSYDEIRFEMNYLF